mmetsp:Transcript_43462/g.68050  ORF Transcript_43462/g.68050 Transcript_43462/m.68050 type:complete len:204 (+) Transcript_43462:699-1310(+)
MLTGTGFPASTAAVKEAAFSGSTPMTVTSGLRVLTASAMPAMRPAPPTGTTTTSTSGTCSTISNPMVPAPATIGGSSYPLMYWSPLNSELPIAWSLASPKCIPWRTTLAPSFRHRSTFTRGAISGMMTVTGIPRSPPWYDKARAWFPADAAITPFCFCSSGKANNAFLAPRSLKDPVNCLNSCFRWRSSPVNSDSPGFLTQGV